MYLADSHVVLWLVNNDADLGRSARAAIRADPTFVSSMTVLELTIKKMNGRLVIPDSPKVLIDQQGLRELPMTADHAAAIRAFPELSRHDPFDRALIAQAKVERLTLLTSDRRLLALGYDWIVDATV